ncbi:MAG: rod-binding protein [Opitutaceae bacterium]|nr:rod-binding protein [Opitutaceae bacterium]
MSAASITPLLGVADSATVQRALQSGGKRPNAAAAAEQFEAILVRQLLGDALKPMLGGTAGGESEAPGSDVYQYFVTDVIAQSVAQGGGLGIAKMLVPQLTPKGAAPDPAKPSSS